MHEQSDKTKMRAKIHQVHHCRWVNQHLIVSCNMLSDNDVTILGSERLLPILWRLAKMFDIGGTELHVWRHSGTTPIQ
jgi:hypothetical protein